MSYNSQNPNGQATMANSEPVVIASDQSTIPVSVSGVATAANQTTEITALQLLDDVVATAGSAALTKLYQVGGTDGTNARILSTNTSGHLNIADGGNSITVDGTIAATQSGSWILSANSGIDIGDVTINNAAGAGAVNIQDGGNSITVDGTVSISGTVTVDSELPNAAVLADATANPTVPTVGVANLLFNGTTWDRVRGDITNGLDVDVTRVSGNVTVVQSVAANLNATVTGTVAATQSGSWTISNAAGASAVNIQDGGNSITVDGTVSISGTVTVDSELPTAAALADATANPTVPMTGAANMLYNGTTWDRMRGDTANGLDVDVTRVSGNVTVVQATGSNLNAVVSGTVAATQSGTWSVRNQDGAGNNLASSTTTPAGTEQALIVRNIPSGTQTVSGTVAATQSGTWTVQPGNTANTTPWLVRPSDGTNNVAVKAASTAAVAADPALVVAVSPNNSVTVAQATASNLNVQAVGNIANDSPDSGNPVKIGFQAETAFPTAVANGDRVNGAGDRYGRQLISHIDPAMQIWKSGEYTTTQTGANIWVPTAGNRFVVTGITISTGGTTSGIVTIWGAPTGTTAYVAGTDQVFFRGEFAPSANSKPGAILTPPVPLFSDTTNDCLKITTSAAMTVYVQVYGYEITP